MSKNIIILIFLVLMTVAAFFSVHSFSRVEEEKKKSQLANDKLSEQLVINNAQQKLIDSLSIVTISALDKKNSTASLVNTPTSDSVETSLIRKLKTANEDFIKRNDSTAYQRAKQLEKEGFTAITNNQFDIALGKFNQIIKFSPSFHSSYEIAMLLMKEKKNFGNPEIQQKIKEQIVKNYTWRAPAEELKKIEVQVKQANVQPVKVNITPQAQQPIKSIDVKTPSVKVADKTKATYIIKH